MVELKKIIAVLYLVSITALKFHAQTQEWKTGLAAETDYENGLLKAKETKKKVLVYFRDLRSPGCQKMERTIFLDSTVRTTLVNSYVIIYLNVVDYTPLASHKSNKSKEKFKNVGDYNYDIERSIYKNETQPFFVLLDSEGKLKKTTGNTSDPTQFLKFLN